MPMDTSQLAAYYQTEVADGSYGTASTLAQQQRLGARMKLVMAQMPELSQDPNALFNIVNSPYSDADLAGHAAAIGASASLDGFLKVLKESSPAGQRALWGQLTSQQQSASRQLGYEPPHNDEGSWFSGILGPVAGPAGAAVGGAIHAVGNVVTPVAGRALEGLQWVADQPAHAYRAIATDESALGPLVLGGAAVGGALAAPFTGGLSLGLTAAAVGGGALAGATLGAAVTNPSDWWDAYSSSWDGERTFRPSAQRAAREALADDRLTNLAKDVAWGHDQPGLYDLATQLAGVGDATDPTVYDKSLQKIADRTFTPGSAEHDTFYGQLRNLVGDPKFRQAVDTLQEGKVSPGRDLTRLVGMDPSQGWGRIVSGGTDALWILTLDPTLAVAKASEAYRVARYGINALDKDATVAKMVGLYGKDGGWTRTVDLLADTANRGARGFEDLRTSAPQLQTMFDPIIDWKRANGLDTVTGNDVLDWMTQTNQMTDLVVGRMARPGQEALLPRITRSGQGWAKVKGIMSTTFDAANDADIDHMVRRVANAGDEAEAALRISQRGALPPTPTMAAMQGYSAGIEAAPPGGLYAAVHALADLPVVGYPLRKGGTLMSGLTTLAPTRGAISLVGPDAAREIDQFSELYRVAGVKSWVRTAWRDFILAQENDGQRLNAISQFTDTAMRVGGMDRVAGGEELIARFRDHLQKAYYLGSKAAVDTPVGRMPVGQLVVLDQAYELPIPDITEIRRAVQRSGLLHDVLGVTDAPIIDTAMNRIWKPSVLLRIGFIPRVAGDELLTWIARSGIGNLVEGFGARAVAQGEAHGEVADKATLLGREALDAQELARLDHWRYLAHVRPLERIANRVGFGKNLAEHVLGGYSDFVRSTLAHGVVPGFVEGLSERSRQLISPEGSIRDLFFHGVPPDLMDASRAWTHWADTRVLKTVTSNHTGPWDNEWTGNNYGQLVRTYDRRKGTVEDQMLLPLRGQFERKYIDKDPTFMTAVHETFSKNVDDPFQGPVIRDFFTHFLPPGLPEDTVRAAHRAVTSVGDPMLRQLLVEATTGEPDARIVKNLVGRIRNPELRKVVYGNMPLGDLSPEGIYDAVKAGLDVAGRDTYGLTVLKNLGVGPEDARQLGLLLHAHQGGELPTEWKTADQLHDHLLEGLRDQAADPDWMHQLTRSRQSAVSPTGMPVAQAPARGTTRMYFPTADPSVFENLLGLKGDPEAIYQSVRSHLVSQLDQMGGTVSADRMHHVDLFASQLAHSGPAVWDEMARVANEAGHGVTPLTIMAFDDPRMAEELSRALQSRWAAGDTIVPDGAGGLVGRGEGSIPAESAHYAYADLPDDLRKFREGELYGIHRPIKDGRHRAWMVDSDAISTRAQIVPKGTPMVRTTRGPIEQLTDTAHIAPQEGTWYHGTTDAWYDEHPNPGFAEGNPGSLYGPGLYMTDTPAIAHDYGTGGWDPLNTGTNTVYRLEPTEPWKLLDLDHPTPAMQTHLEEALDEAWTRLAAPAINAEHTPPSELLHRNPADNIGDAYRNFLDDISTDFTNPDDIGVKMAKEVPKILQEKGYDGFTHLGGQVVGNRDHQVAIVWDPEAAWVTGANKLNRQIPIGPKVPGISYEDAVQERMTQRAQDLDGMLRAGLVEDRKVPLRAKEHAYDEQGNLTETLRSDIYNSDGKELPAGEVMNHTPMRGLRDSAGNPVDEREVPWDYELRDNGDRQLLHEIFAPMIMDSIDDTAGHKTYEAGARVLRSKVGHVIDSKGTDLPNAAVGPIYTAMKGGGAWDRAVRFGFNRIIGPAVDAIIRKPMAFHMFAEAHRDLMAASAWMRSPEILSALDRIAPTVDTTPLLAAAGRAARTAKEGEVASADDAAMWLRGLGGTPADSVDALVERAAKLRARGDTALADDHSQLAANIAHLWADPAVTPGDRLLRTWMDMLPDHVRRTIPSEWSAAQRGEAQSTLPAGLFRVVADDDHAKLLQAGEQELTHVNEHARDLAVEKAVNMMTPWIDSHHYRSQFADQAKAFLPFQFAEENMIKRLGRTLRVAPEAVERMRLGYEGLKSGGVIRTDANGQDWFVYPGSGLLTEALGKVPGFGDILATGVMFQVKPEMMLPGIQNFGAPSATPLITIPLDVIGSQFPELKPLQDALAGPGGTKHGVLRAFFPASVMNMVDAFTVDDSDAKFASAMASAAKILQANGHGLPENATDMDVQDFLGKLRGHARTVLVAQALTGFIAPGAPTAINTGNPGSLAAQLSGVGIDNPAEVMSTDYLALVRNLGIQEGTVQYLKEHPNADPWQAYSTLAVSEPNTKSKSGARIPVTQASMDFFHAHQTWIGGLPNAGPWFIPPAKPGAEASGIDRSAYDEQLAVELRQRQSPDEFVRSMYFKVAGQKYFTAQDSYHYELSQARTAGQKRVINSTWQRWQSTYLAAHPLFSTDLQTGNGAQRRTATINEMRQAVNDPEAPQAWHTGNLRELQQSYDHYDQLRTIYGRDRKSSSVRSLAALKLEFSMWADRYVLQHPEVEPYWSTILKPESALPDQIPAESAA